MLVHWKQYAKGGAMHALWHYIAHNLLQYMQENTVCDGALAYFILKVYWMYFTNLHLIACNFPSKRCELGFSLCPKSFTFRKFPKEKQFLLLIQTQHTTQSVSSTLCSLHKDHLGVGLEVVPTEEYLLASWGSTAFHVLFIHEGQLLCRALGYRRTEGERDKMS